MKRGMNRSKRAQQLMGMPFSLIFSIILIIFFIVIAFIAINHFLNLKKCTQTGLFVQDLQEQIDKSWNSEKASFTFNSNLPTNVKYVCFANFSKGFNAQGLDETLEEEFNLYGNPNYNLLIYPVASSCDLGNQNIKHISINKITSQKNPYCIKVDKGQIKIKISKEINEALVNLS
jgi:hypothetical protein